MYGDVQSILDTGVPITGSLQAETLQILLAPEAPGGPTNTGGAHDTGAEEIAEVDSVTVLAQSFKRALLAANKAPRTIESYLEACTCSVVF